MILLVRHAVAVARTAWDGDDQRRPLTRRGERQADELVRLLEPYAFDAVISSPTRRCTATVVPIARDRGLPVKTRKVLTEGRGADALDLVLDAIDDIVLCTHGDVVGDVLDGLRGVGWAVPARPRKAKGGVWVLQRDRCEFLAPPA